jgi:hypothetical protein
MWEDEMAKLSGLVEQVLAGHDVVVRGFSDDGRVAVAIVDRAPDAAVEEIPTRWGDRVRLQVGSVTFEFM